jgi:hypothetical protein
MAERAGLFESGDDFDVSTFTPKKAVKPLEPDPAPEAIRAVSETADFRSREPVQSGAKPAMKPMQRRRRTGRNLQLNVKVAAKTLESFYEITDRQGWVLGETLERAIAALQRELTARN